MMIIHYTNAPCGAGKSYTTAQRMLIEPGRYLVVRDKIEAMSEYMSLLVRLSSASVKMEMICSEANAKSVRVRIEALPERFRDTPHVIIIITHRAMMMSDLSQFAGWQCIVDETPPVLDQQTMRTKASLDFFAQHYALTPVHNGWSGVTLSEEGWGLTPSDFHNDDLVSPLRNFHERVTMASPPPSKPTARALRRSIANPDRRQGVMINISRWEDMGDGRAWTWWSLWTPKALSAFDYVEFMGNGFQQSFTFELWKQIDADATWIERQIPPHRPFQNRKVILRFYASKHNASAYLFGTDTGRNNLTLISHDLHDDRQRIWMANSDHASFLSRISGHQLSPKKAGSNAYSHHHEAACIYTSKPDAGSRAVMQLLGVDPDVWISSHEHETILQFACRTSVRDPDSAANVIFTVYDENQAEYLKRYFDAQPHTNAIMEVVDLGFAEQEPNKGGRPKLNLTEDEVLMRKARRAAKAREARAKQKAKAA